VYTNASVSLELARFISDRVNSAMGILDYTDVGPYALFKSLRLPECPKVSLSGEVNANSRYSLPDGHKLHDYLVTCTIGCVNLQAPLHISQKLPIDPIYQFGINKVTDPQLNTLKQYVRDELKCPDAILRPEGHRVMINFANKPICPYHKRVHENENMYARLIK